MTPTTTALVGYVLWTLFVVHFIIVYRSISVVAFKRPANDFPAAVAHDGPPLYQRAIRAHMNCIENLGLFTVVAFAAIVTGNGDISDQVAYTILGTRIVQSLIHLISESPTMVTIRLGFLLAQHACIVYIAVQLLLQSFI